MNAALRNIFVTQNFPPESGGMSRRHAELVARYAEPMDVSTVAGCDPSNPDQYSGNRIYRQGFTANTAKLFPNQVRWGHWLASHCMSHAGVIHCGEIRPTGYAVWWAHSRARVPYVIYVNGGDLLRERQKAARHWSKRVAAVRIMGGAAGVVANSDWTAALARHVMAEIGVADPPPVAAIDLGTDPQHFHPSKATGALRARLGVGDAPMLLCVARLVPHKGQDTAIRILAELSGEYPSLHFVVVGKGDDGSRLRSLAAELQVSGRVHLVGQLADAELAEAYAGATAYIGMSRLDNDVNVEGFGISFVEASASALPVIAGDSGGVRSAVRDSETGLVVSPTDVAAGAQAVRQILGNGALRARMRSTARQSVETHFNWDRVASETLAFVRDCVHARRVVSD